MSIAEIEFPVVARKKRPRRKTPRKPPLSIAQILAWADAFHERTGRWPDRKSGFVEGFDGTTWRAINSALGRGDRGLAGGTTLAKVLKEHRGVRHYREPPPLTIAGILTWADEYHARNGDWPTYQSGKILNAPHETWCAVNSALIKGARGLAGGSTLKMLLKEQRGVRHLRRLPQLSIARVLHWADKHREAYGAWPTTNSGEILGVLGETWNAINSALKLGSRGIGESTTLASLLAKERGERNLRDLPAYRVEEILEWIDRWRGEFGVWPNPDSGPIGFAPGETWGAVNSALYHGRRGLPGGDSLTKLLIRERGVRNVQHRPKLNLEQIRGWIQEYARTHGRRPTADSGVIAGSDGDTWLAVDSALRHGRRGLAGGSSLARFLGEVGVF